MEDSSRIKLYPVDMTIIESALIKSGSLLSPSSSKTVISNLNETIAQCVVSVCENGSNSPTIFPGDEMFEADIEESFIYLTQSAVISYPVIAVSLLSNNFWRFKGVTKFASAGGIHFGGS